MKGSERNQPCPCGSGLKRKRCEPGHPPAGAELERLMAEARYEDFRRTNHRLSRRRLPAAVMMAAALAAPP